MIVVADTSGIIAAIDSSSPENASARRVMDTASLLVVAPLVLAELDHLVGGRWGKQIAGQLVDQLLAQARSGRYALADVGVDVLAHARAVQRRYRDLKLDLCDAVLVALAHEYATDAVLTLDRKDFRAVRPMSGSGCFQILPDDLP